MQRYSRILIVSRFGDEVQELINVLPAQSPKYQEAQRDPAKYPRGHYQRIINQDDIIFDIFGSTGDIVKYDFMLEISLEGIPGVILLVDQDRPETYEDSKAILALLHSYNLDTPIVVVDIAPTSDSAFMRKQLEMLGEEQLLSCNIKDLNSIKNVILTLVRLIPEYAQNTGLFTALDQI